MVATCFVTEPVTERESLQREIEAQYSQTRAISGATRDQLVDSHRLGATGRLLLKITEYACSLNFVIYFPVQNR